MAAPSIYDMARATGDLARLEDKRLAELDELTLRHRYENVDRGLDGLRIMVARAKAATQLLADLAPHEVALLAWLKDQRAAAVAGEPAPPSDGGI